MVSGFVPGNNWHRALNPKPSDKMNNKNRQNTFFIQDFIIKQPFRLIKVIIRDRVKLNRGFNYGKIKLVPRPGLEPGTN